MKRISRRARRMPTERAAAPLVALVVLAVVGGCSSSPSLSRAQYRRQVSAICRSTAATVAALPAPDPVRVKQMVTTGRRVINHQRDSVRLIQGLDAPAADEVRVGRWLDLVGRALDANEVSLRAQARLDLIAAAETNAESAALSARADTIARSLRIPACAPETPTPPTVAGVPGP